MDLKLKIIDLFYQVSALTEVKLKLRLRYKSWMLNYYLQPMITIIMPLIVMGRFLNLTSRLGPWNADNYYVFILMAYIIMMIKGIINEFPSRLLEEKYWKTITALILAPFNRFVLLISNVIAHILYILIPISVFFILLFLFYPVSIFTFIFVILLFITITIIFSGIGLLIGVFAISEENIWQFLAFCFDLIFWFSCITYPYELFPEVLQNLINLNPLYYVFDLLRYAWIEDNFFLTINTHFFNFFIMIILAIIIPLFGVIIFNAVYKKYGISGY